MRYTLGIDAGSSFTKAVVLGDGALLSSAMLPSGGSFAEAGRRTSREALEKAALSDSEISETVATGYGAGTIDFAGRTVADITSHATGVFHLFPSARTVIDIGSQFCRVIKLDGDGRVSNFVHNEKCAGGSGKFLQVIARILHMRVEDIGTLSLESTNPVKFTTGCAVFAESEAISRIAEGATPADILAGVHVAMSAKIVNLTVRLGLAQDCVVTGGGAKDIGLIRTLEAELDLKVLVPPDPQITAALGAALSALRMER
ncbi:MAG TPA: acyl-CoA dehydratase activase [Acidobacteriota bacterium]|nr:acyl-CoA dehydratase activase [Acidobacteriota bacterium]